MKRWLQQHGANFADHLLIPIVILILVIIGGNAVTKMLRQHDEHYLRMLDSVITEQTNAVRNH